MTREEAIEILKQFKRCLADVVFDEKGSEAWQMAIKALSQEPCDDAISREAVIKILEKYNLEMSKIAEDVSELPSVTQSITRDIEKSNFSQEQYLLDTDSAYQIGYEQGHKDAEQKSGKWHIAHGMYEDRFWCSCGYIRIMDSRMNEWKYCPVCGGAKMGEPQESEE